MSTFSIEEVLQIGWRITKERFWFLAGAVLIIFVAGGIPAMVQRGTGTDNSVVVGIGRFIINLFVEMGMIRIALNLLDGKPVTLRNFWSEREKFLPFLGASILFTVMFGVGLILLIIPGIFVAATYGLYSYMIIDKNVGVVEALKMSAAATKGNKWKLLGFWLVAGLLNIIGALLLGIGLFWTLPVTAIGFAVIYRKLAAGLTPATTPATPTPVSQP